MSQKMLTGLLLAGLCCAVSSTALASGGRLAQYDTNGDGVVTDDEIIAARTEDFNTYAGDDGQLSLAEYVTLQSMLSTERIESSFNATDTDNSSSISLAEFTARSRSNNSAYLTHVFNLADSNNDEALSLEEFANLRDRGDSSGIWGFARLDTSLDEMISLAEYTTIERRRGRGRR